MPLGPKRVSRVCGRAAAIVPPERARKGEEVVLRPIAALAIASTLIPAAMASTSPALSTAAWWERVTVTFASDGKTQTCRYESSTSPDSTTQCKMAGTEALAQNVSASKGETATVIFERSFHPGAAEPVD